MCVCVCVCVFIEACITIKPLVFEIYKCSCCVLGSVMRLFLMGMHMRSPIIMESITLPCLRILQGLIKQDLVTFLGKKRVSACLPSPSILSSSSLL